jgi:signal transduction histidine kinase
MGHTATSGNYQVLSPTPGHGNAGPDTPAGLIDEHLIKAVVSSIPCIFYECSSDLVVTTASANTYELIGIRSENILGKKAFWLERLSAQDRTRLMARIEHPPATEFTSEINKLTNDSGLPVWVAHSFRRVSRDLGWIIRGCIVPLPTNFNATGLDEGVISQFVHKIGNHYQLMNFLIGSLQRSGMNTDELEALQQTVDRAVEFTRAFSHYTQTIAAISKVDLCELIRSAARAMAPAFFEKSIAFRDILEPSMSGVSVDGDGLLLEFALHAVLQNALEAAKNGDTVVLSGSIQDFCRRRVACVAIVDTGCGIEKELQEKATEPFISSKRDRDGLGLSTAVRIIEMHGGSLKIASSLGQGTKVEILLPISNEAGSD